MSQAGLIDVENANPQIPTQFDADTGSAIPIANVLEVVGGAGIATSASGNTITVSLTGGGAGIDSVAVDASTAPGTDPVVPDGTGLITVTGGQVSALTVGANVIRTNSTAINSYAVEVQQAGAVASLDTTYNGVAHFNNTQFNVSQGFVSLKGGGLAIDSITMDTGTSPITPSAAGLIALTGAVVAAGTNPIRTDGTGVNIATIEVQKSQALAAADATKIGLSNFNSSMFSVDSDGFVGLASGFADLHTAKWIVNGTPNAGGNQTTIAAAIAAASSGDTIFIFPGTYPENLTLKAGVSLAAYTGDSVQLESAGYGPQVIIEGTHTINITGKSVLNNIFFQNSAGGSIFTVSGSGLTAFSLNGCYFNVGAAGTLLTYSNSNANSSVQFQNSNGNLAGAASNFLTMSSIGQLSFLYCNFTNSIQSFAANAISAGTLTIRQSTFLMPFITSGTASIGFINATILCTNTTCLTVGGSGAHSAIFCHFNSGSASAISISSTITSISQCTIYTTNVNSISGAGTINYSGLEFGPSPSTSNISVTTQNVLLSGPSARFGSTNNGNVNTVSAENISNTASSGTNILSIVAGSTAADPTHQSSVSGVTTWTWGIDNSVTSPTVDPWVLAQGSALGTNNVMSVATSGEINYPLQPCFLATNETTDTNSWGDGPNYDVIFDTEIFDQNADYNPATGVFTAPVTGKYQFCVKVALSNAAALTASASLFLVANSRTLVLDERAYVATSPNGFIDLNGSCIIDMTAGNTAKVQISGTTSGATKTGGFYGAAGTSFTWFSGCLRC